LKELGKVSQNKTNASIIYLIRHDVHINVALWFRYWTLPVLKIPCKYLV